MVVRTSFPIGLPSGPLPAVEGPKSSSAYPIIVPPQFHAMSASPIPFWFDSGQSINLRHTHPDFPGASYGTMWTQSPRDILVDTVVPLFSAPMIGERRLGLILTFSGVPVGSATMQASALAVPVKKGTRSKAAARTRATFRCGILRTVMRSPSARQQNLAASPINDIAQSDEHCMLDVVVEAIAIPDASSASRAANGMSSVKRACPCEN